jgi:hypothetical protein
MTPHPRDAHDPATSPSGAPTTGAPLELSHADMNAAYDSGQAVPFAQAVPWLVRYQDAWWVVYEAGWLRVVDDATAENLDQRAAQMTDADAAAARNAAIRGAVTSQAVPPDERL